ncbi:PGA [Symbiodinium natans]|uniref:PGA protein n=1 Tax=Symbiodinium natans TaxID=878477 RepID=A0A812VDC0_9DINO|nr:PGA [Symbiodinium natans]
MRCLAMLLVAVGSQGAWAALLRRAPVPTVTPLMPRGSFASFASASGDKGMAVSSRQLQDLLRHSPRRHGLRKSLFGLGTGGAGEVRGIVRLEDLSSAEYVGTLGVGTSANCTRGGTCAAAELRVIFDTGSADLWVASDLCTLGPCAFPKRHRFNRSSSRTFRQPARPEQFETEYGSGRLRGILGSDDVFVGPFRVKAQSLGLISEESGDAFTAFPIDGIVGLAFPALSVKTRTLLDNLVQEKAMFKPEFAFYLHKDPSRGGAVIWGGGADRMGLHEGEMTWFPIAEERYWSLSLRGFRLGGEQEELLPLLLPQKPKRGDGPISFAEEVPERAALVVDSGTTFFTAPRRLFNKISQTVWPMSCDKIHTLPEFVFAVGTNLSNHSAMHEIRVPPNVYMIQNTFTGDCMPGIMNMEPGRHDLPFMILGETFLRHYFSVFQRGPVPGESWLGLAPALPSEEAERKLLLAQQLTGSL